MQLFAVLMTVVAFAIIAFFLASLVRTPWDGLSGRLSTMGGDTGAVDLFIPKVWAARLLTRLQVSYVLAVPGMSVNTDYEGEINNAGDTVHIGSLGRPTISTYVKNVTVINPQTLTTTDQTMVIDQSKFFAFELDDVDKQQTRDGGGLLGQAAEQASDGLTEVADAYLGTIMTANAGNVIAPAAITTFQEAYNVLLRLKTKLDRSNTPTMGRWVAVAPEFHSLLLLDPRFTSVQNYGNDDAIKNGIVGYVLGFVVKVSTNLPVGTAATNPAVSSFVIASHKVATTWAQQIRKVEAYRPPDSFSDAIKGLHLYGAKVIRPEAIAVQDVDVTIP
jgi:N4-gp56 family major capsid protein